METVQNSWNNVVLYFAQNPNTYGLILVAFGVLFFVGALRKWEWILRPLPLRISVMRSLFGQRGRVFISAVLLIVFGLGFFFFLGK